MDRIEPSQDLHSPSAPQHAAGLSLAELAAMAASENSSPGEHSDPGGEAALAGGNATRVKAAQMIRSAIAQRNETGMSSEESQEQLANILTATILLNNWSFSFREEPVGADKVAGPRHLLPALMWQVEKMHRVAYGGVSTGILYAPDPANATVGAAVQLPTSGPRSPMALFAIEALQRLQDNFPGPDGALVDSMVREFLDDHDDGLIPWAPGTEARPSLPGPKQGG